jgi:hypothetical protein
MCAQAVKVFVGVTLFFRLTWSKKFWELLNAATEMVAFCDSRRRINHTRSKETSLEAEEVNTDEYIDDVLDT